MNIKVYSEKQVNYAASSMSSPHTHVGEGTSKQVMFLYKELFQRSTNQGSNKLYSLLLPYLIHDIYDNV